jgi:hypothetical protein
VLGPLVLAVEGLAALGDEQGMRIGDLVARTRAVPVAAAVMEQQQDLCAPQDTVSQRDDD